MHPRILALLAVLGAGLFLAAPARAQESLYSVSGVHVDATAASSSEALNAAMAQGRSKAFQILFRRLTRQSDWARQPALDLPSLLRLSRGYTVANERRSTTRYVADVTYIFNPDAVARLLRASGIAYSQGQAKRILVIPMSPNVGHGPWAAALAAPAFHDSLVPFTILGAEDDGALTALNFDGATWNDVAMVAAKNHVAEVALVQAVYGNGKVTVNIRRLGANEAPAKTSLDVPMLQTLGTTYPAAAQAAVRAMEDLWKSRSAVDYSQRGRMTVDVRIASLQQWGDIQAQLAQIGTITNVTVTAMDINYARLSVSYVGGLDQLRESLAAAGLALNGRGQGPWMLASTR